MTAKELHTGIGKDILWWDWVTNRGESRNLDWGVVEEGLEGVILKILGC